MTYLILVGCGSMGSPNPVKVNKLECGIHNECSIAFSKLEAFNRKLQDLEQYEEEYRKKPMKYYNKHIQVCEKNKKKTANTDSEVSLKMYFKKEYLDGKLDKDMQFKLNLSYGVYQSDEGQLGELCNQFNYVPQPTIVEEEEDDKKEFKADTVKFEKDLESVFSCKPYLPLQSTSG